VHAGDWVARTNRNDRSRLETADTVLYQGLPWRERWQEWPALVLYLWRDIGGEAKVDLQVAARCQVAIEIVLYRDLAAEDWQYEMQCIAGIEEARYWMGRVPETVLRRRGAVWSVWKKCDLPIAHDALMRRCCGNGLSWQWLLRVRSAGTVARAPRAVGGERASTCHRASVTSG
jgi:hypothetical protein